MRDCLNFRPGIDPAPPSSSDFDWNRVLELCGSHCVRPLVRRALNHSQWRGIPLHVRETLDRFAQQNLHRNVLLSLELVRIITLLEREGIACATFKGPTLAQSVYGDPGLREFVDIDLVVHPRDVPVIRRILHDNGYRTTSFDRDKQDYLQESGQASFVRPGEGFGLDIHWKLAPFGIPLPFSEEEMWQNLQRLPLANRQVPCLAWDHLALFLAFHGTKERWRSLKWIYDFSALTRSRPELDWKTLLSRASRNHCSRDLLLAARICEEVGLTAPPVLLAAAANDPAVKAIAQRIVQRLATPGYQDELSSFADSVSATERLRDKFRFSLSLMTTLTVSDYALVRLPPRLHSLYYAIRPFRIAAKSARLLLQGFLQRFRAAR